MAYYPEKRVMICEDADASLRNGIEINFDIPCWITEKQQRDLSRVISAIISAPWNQPIEGVHWLSGYGDKPTFSKADAQLLGITDPSQVSEHEIGEPTFDSSILSFHSCAREFVSTEERLRTMAHRPRRAPGEDDI